MKYIATALLTAIIFTGCYSKGNVARVTVSPSYHKGAPLRVLVMPLSVEGYPDMVINDSYTEQLSGTMIQVGNIPLDAHAASRKAGMSGPDFTNIYSSDILTKLVYQESADALLEGSISYTYIPPVSGTNPAQVIHRDSARTSITTYTSASGYSTGGYYGEKSMSLRLVDAHSSMVLVTAYLNDADIQGYFNSSSSYHPIDELVEALKKNLK
ncbi:MAG TPA: hypothetical protein VEW28_07075 [Candidatus Kapabacteria bacterium]|nr:hypothetical protein [Candidatus Kapabacteria bacterium]